jgi:hypothetical protein
MREVGEYLRAYKAYVSANLGWRKALTGALGWLAGMFVPLWTKTLLPPLPTWAAITWMTGWALLGYIFAPYGLWKHQRAQNSKPNNSNLSGSGQSLDVSPP